MTKLTKQITTLKLQTLDIVNKLSLETLNDTELAIFVDIVYQLETNKVCSMLKAVEVCGKSRSTVYKTIRKLVKKNLLSIESSKIDKRSYLLKLKI